jgi:threonine dehydrogenase-like Zn-dependent dehydrogenase
MKAARYHLADHGYVLQCDDVPAPTCRENQVRVRVAFCGICGSDLARYRQISNPPPNLQNLFGTISFIQGHEFSGVIDQIGSQVVDRWEDASPVIGTRVAVHPLIGCGECAACQAKQWNHCQYPDRSQVIGVHRDGGFAEWVTVPFDHVVRVGDNVSLATAALTEPLAVALHAINVAQIPRLDTSIKIIGDGTIGLLIAHVLKQTGYSVHLIGHHLERLALAQKMGATVTRVVEQTKHSTGESAEYVFQVAGSRQAIELGIEMLTGNGQMVCLGYLDSTSDGLDPISFNSLIRNEKCLRGSFGSSYAEFESALRGLATGQYDLSPLIGDRITLDAITTRGFDALLGNQKPMGKVLVQVGTEI